MFPTPAADPQRKGALNSKSAASVPLVASVMWRSSSLALLFEQVPPPGVVGHRPPRSRP